MKIARMTCGTWGKTVAYFDAEFPIRDADGIDIGIVVVKGFRLVEGSNGLFVGVPSVKDDDGEYQNKVYLDKPVMEMLLELAKNAHAEGGSKGFTIKTHPRPTAVAEAPPLDDEDIPF